MKAIVKRCLSKGSIEVVKQIPLNNILRIYPATFGIYAGIEVVYTDHNSDRFFDGREHFITLDFES